MKCVHLVYRRSIKRIASAGTPRATRTANKKAQCCFEVEENQCRPLRCYTCAEKTMCLQINDPIAKNSPCNATTLLRNNSARSQNAERLCHSCSKELMVSITDRQHTKTIWCTGDSGDKWVIDVLGCTCKVGVVKIIRQWIRDRVIAE